MIRFRIVFLVLLAAAILTSALAVSGLVASSSSSVGGIAFSPQNPQSAIGSSGFGVSSSLIRLPDVIGTAQRSSLFVAPACWIFVVGAWIWRGRVRARWTQIGFGSDVFDLFIKMKGGATRIRMLNALEIPEDRLQVAQQLGLDWKAVDRHIQVLNGYGLVREKGTYGTAKIYEVTPLGRALLRLCDELEEADRVKAVEQRL